MNPFVFVFPLAMTYLTFCYSKDFLSLFKTAIEYKNIGLVQTARDGIVMNFASNLALGLFFILLGQVRNEFVLIVVIVPFIFANLYFFVYTFVVQGKINK